MNTDTIKKFIKFFWWLVGFFIISLILENGLINNMYKPMSGVANNMIIETDSDSGLDLSISDAKSTSMNGYVIIDMKNTSGTYIDGSVAKIDLYTSTGIHAGTKYVDLEDFDANETRQYKINFNGEDISRYTISLVDEMPEKSPVIEVMGLKIDTSNFFGQDLSDLAEEFNILDRFGIDNEDLNNWKEGANYGINWGLTLAKSLPTWVYVTAASIVFWNLPAGFFFGLF